MEKYLDITKSIIISSPAGSGKTEKLARRYVSLLLSGCRMEDILAITFTEKAAAEMKERILKILEEEHPDLFVQIRERMPFMRIATIHAFCLKLLKRFSIELGLDPNLEVMDEFNASALWTSSVYESLMAEREHPGLFFSMIVERGVKGWNSLFRIMNELHAKRPHPEMMLKEGHQAEGEEERILSLYARCLRRYTEQKRERHLIDFDDIEIMAYEALVKNPQWQNILYSFDEHTNHILVDEFQDTSSLQWKIIDKLTEEWRSGMGAKRERGEIPTLFFVGDDKQSIYLFRGANAAVFHEARKKLSDWLKEEFHFEAVKENYRSLPEIINFVNSLFSLIMPSGLLEEWRTTYSPFEATRKGTGRVELIMLEGSEKARENREHEAKVLAQRISSLNSVHEVREGEAMRKCTYGDMAILLRKRTHLTAYEDALRLNKIPFIVVKGIGFYDEPEVAVLRELLFFLIDPANDHSLFCILRSPLFGIEYDTLMSLADKKDGPLLKQVGEFKNRRIANAYVHVSSWLERSLTMPLAALLEDALSETGGWYYFREPQRRANVKKFIAIIEDYETRGFSGLEMREKLMQSKAREESKAHVNTEGMNAVRIMTIHAAKGLQFPMVFLPGLDEEATPKSSSIVIDEEGENLYLAYESDSLKRNEHRHFRIRREKEREEEKRLFYVSVTRAQDFLCMLASPKKGKSYVGRLKYITDNLSHLPSLRILREQDIDALARRLHHPVNILPVGRLFSGPHWTEPIIYEPPKKWRDVTEDPDVRVRHGEDWVLLGKIFHMLFEELSGGITPRELLSNRALALLKREVPHDKDIMRLFNVVHQDFLRLERAGYLQDIILAQENSFSELPFILQMERTVYRGRIDRIIIRGSRAYLYDYKTFPASQRELPELMNHYRFQMNIYCAAAEKLFEKTVMGYLLFTHLPLLLEM